jgi:hypothetical protein
MGWITEELEFDSPTETRCLSLSHSIQTSSGAHLAYLMGTEALQSSKGIKGTHLHLVPILRIHGAMPPPPTPVFMI